MSSKTYKRYSPESALKGGCASSIDSACTKMIIANAFVDIRGKYKKLKIEYLKQEQELKASRQDSKEKIRLIGDVQKKNDTIKKHLITITQRENEIKTLKDISVHRNEVIVLEGKLKKKDHEIEELKKQINSTKINNVEHLKNTIHQQNEQIKYLKEGYGKFNVEDESLKQENMCLEKNNQTLNERLSNMNEENELLKEGLDRLKEEHGELIEKLDKFQKVITEIYDDF
jgi:chromosome segregation ATPase